MFVKKAVRRRGDKVYTYLDLVESERRDGRNRHRALCRLGEVTRLRDSGQLDRMIGALRMHSEQTWIRADQLTVAEAPAFGAMAATMSYYRRLSLDDLFAQVGSRRGGGSLADTVAVIVAVRLIRPASMRRTILEWLKQDVALPDDVEAPSLWQCYRALDVVGASKEELEDHLRRQLRALGFDARSCLYDVTSSPVDVGRGRADVEGDSDRSPVVIGVLMTRDGFPLTFDMLGGDDALVPLVGRLREKHGAERVSLVADRRLIWRVQDRGLVQRAVRQAADHAVPVEDRPKDVVLDGQRYVLVGRLVLATSLGTGQASAGDVLRLYRGQLKMAGRHRVFGDFFGPHPLYHFTEGRIRAHAATCLIAAAIEAMMARDIQRAKIKDLDHPGQIMTPQQALAELNHVRLVTMAVGDHAFRVVTRPNTSQARILAAFGVDLGRWESFPPG
jgi:hypothetical protein